MQGHRFGLGSFRGTLPFGESDEAKCACHVMSRNHQSRLFLSREADREGLIILPATRKAEETIESKIAHDGTGRLQTTPARFHTHTPSQLHVCITAAVLPPTLRPLCRQIDTDPRDGLLQSLLQGRGGNALDLAIRNEIDYGDDGAW